MKKDHRVYLDDIVSAISDIIGHIGEMTKAEFMSDVKTQDAVIRK